MNRHRKGSARPGAWQASGRARHGLAAVASSRRNNHITIYAQGKPVGHVDIKTGIFHKTCRASLHMLRKPAGWALDVGSLDEAERAGAHTVEITDAEANKTYVASIRQIRSAGILLDRGFGQQFALPLTAWVVRDPLQPSFWEVA